jgi:aromatic ring-opening dioxygenase catalytic subunit (LigB family)
MPLLNDVKHKEIISSLRTRVPKILNLDSSSSRPRAIVVVTAHWSTNEPTISSGASPQLFYDYYGFPPETYELKYDAPGNPEVAHEIAAALKDVGFTPELDDERGWDHGVFVPMTLIRPQADIPVVQMSVLASEDTEAHNRMGKALLRLRENNVAVVASGFASFHNLRLLFSGITEDEEFRARNKRWNQTLDAAVGEEKEEKREERLKGWRAFEGGREMHPMGAGEHFMPLLVAAGAGGEGKPKSYTDDFMGLDMFSWYWE